MRTVNKTLKGR